jgi:hypothetical protein
MQNDRNARATTLMTMDEDIASWEDEGGATSPVTTDVSTEGMSGTQNQVEWAEQIRLRVDKEFDRVSAAIASRAAGRSKDKQAEAELVLTILESKREAVMRRRAAGYFIHDWQEIDDQVRRMILTDECYVALKANRKVPGERKKTSANQNARQKD